MFVEKTSSCWVDLRDTKTEIIMNNYIKAPEDSPHGNDVVIELYNKETKDQIEIKKDNGKNIVYIEDFRESGAEKVMLPFLLKLKVADHPDLGDLQYVMDAKVLPEIDEDEPEKAAELSSKPRLTAEFTRSKGCENQRAHGRKNDKGLTLNVSIPASIFASSDVNEQAVDVVAGWACGHEAVTLTESIQFRLMTKEPEEVLEKNEMVGKPIESDEKEENEQLVNVKEIERNIRRRHKEEILEHLHEAKKHRMEEVHHHLNLQRLNKFYEKTRFGKASFTNHKYMKGLFVIVVIGIIALKLLISRGKKTKGRRDL